MSTVPVQRPVMIGFEWPWVFLLLPVPWVVRVLLPPAERVEGAALRVPFLDDFRRVESAHAHRMRRRWPLWTAIAAWILGVAAGVRPIWLGDAVELPITGRDLMLAVDLSASMEEKDFEINGEAVNRLTAIKAVAGKFIEHRAGDRIGLILFGEQAYLQVPLTFDRKTVSTLLEESTIGLAGNATAIGNAIGLAVKRLRGKDAESRVLVLLTDGANTAGEIDPLKAAELARKEGLRIYAIGVGADEVSVRSLFGVRRVNPSVDLDEKSLRAIAETTGGRYFRARDTEDLQEIYGLLDKLEPVEADPRLYRPTTALYAWPLGGALLLSTFLVGAASKGSLGA